MAKPGRPQKYHSLEEVREAQRTASANYYKNNRDLVLEKAKNKRKSEKEEQEHD